MAASHRSETRPLADFLDSCLGKAFATRGFAASDIVLAWPDIVGEAMAAHSQPVKLVWPSRPRSALDDRPQDPAILNIRVEGGFALELQHRTPQIIERINTYFGWACVGRLRFEQAPLRRKPRKAPKPPPSPQAMRAAEAAAEGIEDAQLREAVIRLGAAVLSRAKP